jgi:hypothetical protein
VGRLKDLVDGGDFGVGQVRRRHRYVHQALSGAFSASVPG